MALSVGFLVLLCMPVIAPDLGSTGELVLDVLNVAVWLVFAVDYVTRLALAQRRAAFVRDHIPDLIIVLVPMLRALRLLRLLRVFSLARMFGRRASANALRDVGLASLALTCFLVFFGGVAVLLIERNAQDAQITGFADAAWWSLCTMTLMAYGEVIAVTHAGHMLAVPLQLAGIVLFGLLSAALAAWMVRQLEHSDEAVTTVDVSREELRRLLSLLDVLEARAARDPSPDASPERTS